MPGHEHVRCRRRPLLCSVLSCPVRGDRVGDSPPEGSWAFLASLSDVSAQARLDPVTGSCKSSCRRPARSHPQQWKTLLNLLANARRAWFLNMLAQELWLVKCRALGLADSVAYKESPGVHTRERQGDAYMPSTTGQVVLCRKQTPLAAARSSQSMHHFPRFHMRAGPTSIAYTDIHANA